MCNIIDNIQKHLDSGKKEFNLSEKMPKGIYNHKPHTEKRRNKISKSLTGRKFSEEHLKKIRDRQKGETHSCYKGDKANQNVIHRWVEKRKPRIKFCEECGEERKLNLASLTNHNYTRNVEDYKWLCYSCHKHLDLKCHRCKRNKIKLHMLMECDDCRDWRLNFIQKLKDKIRETPNISKFDLRAEIDKLAGRKLVEGDGE